MERFLFAPANIEPFLRQLGETPAAYGKGLHDALRRATVLIVRAIVWQRGDDFAARDPHVEMTARADCAGKGIRTVAGSRKKLVA